MTDISRLLFQREHFPIPSREFEPVKIPPFHELIRQQGIDVELAAQVILESLEAALLDLKDFKRYEVHSKGGKPRLIKADGEGVTASFHPFFNTLYIGRDKIATGDPALYLERGRWYSSLYVPDSVVFTPQLLREYSMQEGTGPPGYKKIECVLGWRTHNVNDNLKIIFKNIVIAIDNAVVRRKYSK